MNLLFVIFLVMAGTCCADEMNLNEFMPTKLEDATPSELDKTELQLTTHFDQSKPDVILNRFNPRYGLNKYAQLEAMASVLSGGNERSSGETMFGGLFRLNQPKGHFPMIAIMPFAVVPTGKLDRGVGSDVKLALTSTLKGTNDKPDAQVHVNIEHVYNPHASEGGRFNQYEVAFGFTYRVEGGTALVADFFHEQEQERGKEINMLEAGVQHNMGKEWYLGLGAGGRVGAGPSWNGNLSLIKQL